MENRFRFRHVNELTGLFVLAVIAMIVVGIVVSGRSQRWFSRKYEFDVLLPAKGASGLSRGSGVFIFGVAVGSVGDIMVDEDGSMKAQVKIRGDFERFLRADSVATIKKVFGVAGDSFIEISAGTGAQLPAKDPAIECQAEKELSGMLETMLADLNTELIPAVKRGGTMFDAWAKLGLDLQKSQANLNQLISRLDRVVTRLEQGEGTVGTLLTDAALVVEAQRALTQASESMAALRSVMTNAEAVVEKVERSVARLPEITSAFANEVQDLPGLVVQTQQTLRELERLVEGFQRHWLVRKYIDQENTSGGRLSSIEVPGGQP